MNKIGLLEEFNKRKIIAERVPVDEQWFRDTMQLISNGAFSCYGQGCHLTQEKECEWGMTYQLLTEIKGVDATIMLKVTKEDFKGITAEYRKYHIIQEAIANGWISINARMIDDNSIRLYSCLDWDIGDSGNYGRWTINLMAYLDKSGKYIKHFFIQDSRM